MPIAPPDDLPEGPVIPSFDSLRGPRRRSAVDVLMPEPAVARPAPGPGPRPPDYADLLRLGVRGARLVTGVPWRMASWMVRTPAALVGRLLGR